MQQGRALAVTTLGILAHALAPGGGALLRHNNDTALSLDASTVRKGESCDSLAEQIAEARRELALRRKF
jgi:hypothetical protein